MLWFNLIVTRWGQTSWPKLSFAIEIQNNFKVQGVVIGGELIGFHSHHYLAICIAFGEIGGQSIYYCPPELTKIIAQEKELRLSKIMSKSLLKSQEFMEIKHHQKLSYNILEHSLLYTAYFFFFLSLFFLRQLF